MALGAAAFILTVVSYKALAAVDLPRLYGRSVMAGCLEIDKCGNWFDLGLLFLIFVPPGAASAIAGWRFGGQLTGRFARRAALMLPVLTFVYCFVFESAWVFVAMR